MRFIALLAAVALVAGSVAAHHLRSGGPERDAAHDARAFRSFPLYWAGETFAGLPLTGYVRTLRPATAAMQAAGILGGVNDVTLIYGTCHASSDSGCAPPLEIQMSPECSGNFDGGHLTPGPGPPLTHLTATGVPAALIGIGGDHLELFSGRVSISIFASRALAMRAAAALRPANAPARALAKPGVRLPAPVPPDHCMTG